MHDSSEAEAPQSNKSWDDVSAPVRNMAGDAEKWSICKGKVRRSNRRNSGKGACYGS